MTIWKGLLILANKKAENFYIINDERVLYGPVPWSGKLISWARWLKDVARADNVRIVQVIVDEKAI